MAIVAVRPASTQFRAVEALRGFEAARPAREVPPTSGTEPRGAVPGEPKPAAVTHWGEKALGLARAAQVASSRLPAPGETYAEPTASESTPEESQEIQDLRRRDREVQAHEQAHKAAGGAHAGSIHLQYSVGPDGKRYASSGEVSIDVSPVKGDPEATLRKMEAVQRAATAPAEPSGADRQVGAQAASTAQRARADLAAERYAKARG
jgi:SprA-related family